MDEAYSERRTNPAGQGSATPAKPAARPGGRTFDLYESVDGLIRSYRLRHSSPARTFRWRGSSHRRFFLSSEGVAVEGTTSCVFVGEIARRREVLATPHQLSPQSS